MVCVYERNLDLVRSRRKTSDDDSPPPVSAQTHGAPSTATWRCPIRGDASSAFGPNTGTICRFSVRYWMNTTPRLNGSAKGGSTTIFAAGCGSAV